MKVRAILIGVLPALILACSGSSDPSSTSDSTTQTLPLPVALNRLNSTQFEVVIDASSLSDFSPGDLSFSISNASATAFTNSGGNNYKSTVTANITSGEVPMSLTWGDYTRQITALIFPNIDAAWDQPEAVPGYVNTDGWEDSPEISPDGKYLAVSTYSPVSIVQCLLDGLLKTTPSCNANSFHSLSLQRPNFPGASRVLSSTSIQHTVSILNPPDTTNAYPPVSSYVFASQSDGSFKRPVAVYVDWDAFTWGAPFGFHFRRKVADGIYDMYGAFGDLMLGNGNKLQSFQLDLNGSFVNLGKMYLSSGTLTKSDWAMTPLSIPGLTSQAGNPASSVYGPTGDGYLFWDDESLPANSRDLYFATETAAGVFGSKQTVGLSQAGLDEYQPYFFQSRLYFSLIHGAIYSSALTSAADPALAGSWSALKLELGTDSSHTHTGRISAMGEPSLYQDSAGKNWMYFAYAISGTNGLDLNIGRVRAK